jgi:hypothetical protein
MCELIVTVIVIGFMIYKRKEIKEFISKILNGW